MKKQYKLICIIIVLCLLVAKSNIYGKDNTMFYETSCKWETYNDNPELYKNLSGLPYGTKPIAKGRPFNYRTWFGKGIVVYGTPEQVNTNNGLRVNYKEDTRNSTGVSFYKKRGRERGEYRYDGYTLDGNLYANTNFPYDINSKIALEDRPWIYQYWDNNFVRNNFKGEPLLNQSQYNKTAISEKSYLSEKTREWINNGMTEFKIKNGVMGTGINDHAPEQKSDGTWDFHNFLNVQSAPSAKFNGEGRMFRFSPSGGLFYMAFTINKYQKEHTPVEVSVKILNQKDLEFIDYGKDNPAGFETQELDIKVEVTARLKDEEHIKDPVKKAVYYTREDRSKWVIALDGKEANVKDIQIYDNYAKSIFTVTMSKGQIRALNGNTKGFRANARCIYFDGRYDEGSNQGIASFNINTYILDKKPPFLMEPKCTIPQEGFDIVQFKAADNTDMKGIADRQVLVNGSEIEDELFFSGSYIFGIGQDGLKKIDVYYTDFDGNIALHTTWAYIYDTKPNAQFSMSGTFKQNRKLTVTDNSMIGNVKIVTASYPITSYSWKLRSISGDSSSIRTQDISKTQKNMLFKKAGSYEIELTVTNSLGRISDPAVYKFEIFPDYEPALEIDLDNSIISRLEAVNAWNYNAASTDNDKISKNSIELWYDSNNDGTYDKLLNTFDGRKGFPEFKPIGLGRYKFVNTIEESFGEETIADFITTADRVVKTVEREILVDNLQPMAGLYVQVPVNRPQIDTLIMMDSALANNKVKFLRENRLEFNNYLRASNIHSEVELWDLHTYTYAQPASTTIHTGGSLPPATTEYISNGYFGVLERTSTSNSRYQTDEGSYRSYTESKTVTGTRNGWSEEHYTYNGTRWNLSSSNSSFQPNMEYEEQGFRGTLRQVYFSTDTDNGTPSGTAKKGATYTRYRTYTGHYSGQVSRSVQVWVPNMIWHDDYTGFYSGTIRKDVKQPYTDTFRPTSSKYVIYFTENMVSDINDLNSAMSRSDSKLILIGSASIKQQVKADRFIVNDKPVDKLIQEALEYIAEGGIAEEYYVLAGVDELTLNIADFDEENDSLVERRMQYVQDADYFDNGVGMESYAVENYGEETGWVNTVINKINKPGKYTIYRRVRDNPTTNPAFRDFARYSGTPFINIYAHRKPLALASLDWDFNQSQGNYRTSWVDSSYDPDHQYNRLDKGIVERKIMYRQTGGEWYYRIPDNLSPGTYELHYFVKDPEGAWSDPLILNFTLDAAPSIQLNADLRTLSEEFSLAAIPASEKLEAFNLWTRFPNNVRLEMALYNGVLRVSPMSTVAFGNSTGTKILNDITWNNVVYQIPATIPDRKYDFRISAVGDDGRTTAKSFEVQVSTPINLNPSLPSEVSGGTTIDATALTSKYAGVVNVELFQGTTHPRVYSLTASEAGQNKTWEGKLAIPGNIPDGDYIARFTAIAPNGSIQVRDLPFKLMNLGIRDVSISGYWNHWRGQVDILGERLANEPHRFLSLECVNIDITTLGNPDRVTVRFSPELEAMNYTDPNGHSYNYSKDFFGYQVLFPRDSTLAVSGNHASWEYHLPLAPSSKDWDNSRLRPTYRMTVTAYKASRTATYVIDDIDITGNIYDLTYIQPKN